MPKKPLNKLHSEFINLFPKFLFSLFQVKKICKEFTSNFTQEKNLKGQLKKGQ